MVAFTTSRKPARMVGFCSWDIPHIWISVGGDTSFTITQHGFELEISFLQVGISRRNRVPNAKGINVLARLHRNRYRDLDLWRRYGLQFHYPTPQTASVR